MIYAVLVYYVDLENSATITAAKNLNALLEVKYLQGYFNDYYTPYSLLRMTNVMLEEDSISLSVSNLLMITLN